MVGDSGWRSPVTFFGKVFSEQSWTLGRKPQCHLEQALSWDPETKEARCSGRPGVQKSGHLLDSNLLQNMQAGWRPVAEKRVSGSLQASNETVTSRPLRVA